MRTELYHHGILGQKWGKKNGPPYPLGSRDHSKAEKSAGWRKSLGGGRNEHLYDRKRNKKSQSTLKKRNANDSKKETSEVKQKNKQNENRKWQKSDTYKAIGAGLIALGIGTAGYIAYRKYGSKFFDYYITPKAKLVTLSTDTDRIKKGKQFYTAFKFTDKIKYSTNFDVGIDLKTGDPAYKKELHMKVINKIKIANEHSSRKEFTSLLKNDKNFQNSFYDLFLDPSLQNKIKKDGWNKTLKNKKSMKDLYKIFNTNAPMIDIDVNPSQKSKLTEEQYKQIDKMKDLFYAKLKSKGYSGFVDVNDQGWTSKPTIIFDKQKILETVVEEIEDRIFIATPRLTKRSYVYSLEIPKETLNNALMIGEAYLDALAPSILVSSTASGAIYVARGKAQEKHEKKSKK